MEPIWGAWLLIILGAGLLLFRFVHRPPKCPECRIPAEPVCVDRTEAGIPVLETAYWCPRCAQVISRRYVIPLWDW